MNDISFPKVVIVKKLPFKWTLAINLFNKVYAIRELNQRELQHETIHSLQMKNLGYVRFYFQYVCEWLKNYRKYRDCYLAYRNISFEKEAYTYENDFEYIVKLSRHN